LIYVFRFHAEILKKSRMILKDAFGKKETC